MTGLLECRERLKLFYSKWEVILVPFLKFLITSLMLHMINEYMGYLTPIDNLAIVVVVSLICSLLPNGMIPFLGAAFILLHMKELSIEVAGVTLCVFLIMFLLFGRFRARESLVMVITPMAFAYGIPYAIPVLMGLLGSPASCAPIGCGIVVYYLLQTVIMHAPSISTMGNAQAMQKVQLILDGLLDNRPMQMYLIAFTITVLVVYLIRRMAVEHSWTIAMTSGVIAELVILVVGDLLYDTNLLLLQALLGILLTVLIAKIVEFFRFCLDYERTENVQFEDDEYYYYVKAIPKLTVATPTKTVKRINTQTRSYQEYSEPVQSTYERKGYYGNHRNVAAQDNYMQDDEEVDYEDIF